VYSILYIESLPASGIRQRIPGLVAVDNREVVKHGGDITVSRLLCLLIYRKRSVVQHLGLSQSAKHDGGPCKQTKAGCTTVVLARCLSGLQRYAEEPLRFYIAALFLCFFSGSYGVLPIDGRLGAVYENNKWQKYECWFHGDPFRQCEQSEPKRLHELTAQRGVDFSPPALCTGEHGCDLVGRSQAAAPMYGARNREPRVYGGQSDFQ
jgi:hypothetical protein